MVRDISSRVLVYSSIFIKHDSVVAPPTRVTDCFSQMSVGMAPASVGTYLYFQFRFDTTLCGCGVYSPFLYSMLVVYINHEKRSTISSFLNEKWSHHRPFVEHRFLFQFIIPRVWNTACSLYLGMKINVHNSRQYSIHNPIVPSQVCCILDFFRWKRKFV